ncbi:MAG: polynucleotide kinase-phosphatase [Candidatus Competibacteraceae bacterium]|nr:polynucleotide kinase-phosphatase [Candidatus Competibacteraceae bacterium]
MNLSIPELSLVVLIGVSGAGKSTFARRCFLPTEILSSDRCRGLVSDDENDQAATGDAFDVLHFIAAKRLAAGHLTVIDATNVQPEARKPLVALARQYHCLPVALVLDPPESLCHERNRARADRDFGPHVIRNQHNQLKRSLRHLEREGFRHVHIIGDPADIAAATVIRQPLWCNRKQERGPFDLIGDLHGCYDELRELLSRLGYERRPDDADGAEPTYRHPEGRKAVFLGDLVDRGPNISAVLRLVMAMVASGNALCVAGNHDVKLARALRGRQVKISHGLAESLQQLEREPDDFRRQAAEFLDKLVSHYVLDDGRLVAAHAGLREDLQGRGSGRVREFALYGDTTGETDEYGLPVRHDWAAEYRGRAWVVYGHTPTPVAEWLNRTICIDTGCVFGGALTALRYPEKTLVAVPARREYYPPVRPLRPPEQSPTLSAQQHADDLLDLSDVTGKRILHTTLQPAITLREENAAAALEAMSRFAVDPKWLIYLPPTMSPPETSGRDGWLEFPAEALDYYRRLGLTELVCEEKHMGSRAVIILCRDRDATRRRFGIQDESLGVVYTRTGRPFFNDATLERDFLARLHQAAEACDFWERLATDWCCLDTEIMPWSAKAQELVAHQYAAVGAVARATLGEIENALQRARARTDLDPAATATLARLTADYAQRLEATHRYIAAYRHYCWPVRGLDDLKLAPFHLLASGDRTHFDQDHRWHLAQLARLAAADPQWIVATPHRTVALDDPASVGAAIDWWLALTEGGGEGMVIKPLAYIARGRRGLAQPAVKCRGRDYLRIIYGPEYTRPEHLARLRKRGLGAKRGLALREFALGIEALERFSRREPLRRVHECVFGILALESEPVDPRL